MWTEAYWPNLKQCSGICKEGPKKDISPIKDSSGALWYGYNLTLADSVS
jgi:hypothetical protein